MTGDDANLHSNTPNTAETPEDSTPLPWLSHYPEGIDWNKTYEPFAVTKLLDDAVRRYPEQVCTNFFGRTLTYTEIAERVDAAAASLIAVGVGKGDRVGLFLPNCPAFVIYYYATLKVGGTVVNYNPLYSIGELTHQVEDSQTDLMITLDLKAVFGKIETLITNGTLKRAIICRFSDALPTLKSVLFRLLKSGDVARIEQSTVADRCIREDKLPPGDRAAASAVVIDPTEDIAVLQYTGGTTGTPKGAMLSHANLYINTQQVIDWAPELDYAQERVFGALPFFHVFAMTVVMNFGIARASEIVMMPRFVLDDAMKLIARTRPTVMPGVPTLFNAILNHPKLASFDLSSLKFCISGGAALSVDLKKRFEKLTGSKLVEGYGLSETSPVATCNPAAGPVKEGSIGQPLPQTIISLRDLDDPAKEVPPGEKGEICIKGPQVMVGYWNLPQATQETFVGDFLRTGDVAVMDEEGFFYIVDRIKDLIISSGFNVYPRRIEEALYDHPAVDEAIVIGIDDPYRGEAPKAFVKLQSDAVVSKDELMAHLREKLSKIEIPAEIEFRDELPKTMIGKLSRKELREEEQQKKANA